MGLIFDAGLPESQAQTHVLAIGVNDYPHLEGGGGPIAPYPFGLATLSTAAPSAVAFTEWVLATYQNAAPLGTVRLLLSPEVYIVGSAAAAGRLNEPGNQAKMGGVSQGQELSVDRADLTHIKAACQRWRDLGSKHRGNVLIFFFCGHGLEAGDRFLLPADYGSDRSDALRHLINISSTIRRLATCQARTQCFFLDSCRETPKEFAEEAANGVGEALVGLVRDQKPRRDAVIYQAVRAGEKAYSSGVARQGVFTTTLIHCLNGPGAGSFTGTHYPITLDSLATGLKQLMILEGQEPDVEPVASMPGRLPPSLLHMANGPFKVKAFMGCLPEPALGYARLRLEDSAGNVQTRVAPCDRIWALPQAVSLGECDAEVDFDSGLPWRKWNKKMAAGPPFVKIEPWVEGVP